MKRKPKKHGRRKGPIHERIASRREEKGLTQTQLAEKLGVHLSAVSHWENGKRPDVDRLAALASALDLSISELVAGEDWPVVTSLLGAAA